MQLRLPLFLATLLAVAWLAGPAHATAGTLSLAQLPDDAELAALLWQRNPDVVAARARIAQAQAEVDRAERLPNPTLDVAWNTIPIGETNPAHLDQPLLNVPNYQVGLSTPIELGKRAPRKQATRYGRQAALLDAAEILRLAHLDLLSAIGQVATSEERIASLDEQVADAVRLTLLAHERVTHGDAAPLAEEQHHLSEGLLACGRAAGVVCQPFLSVEKAHAFLDTHASLPDPAGLDQALEKRPDLQSLVAQEAAADSALRLARARRLPDPTIRVGYTRDQFLVSGSQENSLGISVSLPLPISERGQADAALALSARNMAQATRRLRREEAQRDLARRLDDFRALKVQQANMRQQYLPLARSLVDSLTATVKAGGAPLPELLLARRRLSELLADSSDLDRSVFEAALALRRLSGAEAISPPQPFAPAAQVP
jgi:cobalt-zinc-cadmium efflux system outer membrane protein